MKSAGPAKIAERFAKCRELFPAHPEKALTMVESLISELEQAAESALLGRALILKGNSLVQLGLSEEAEAFLAEIQPRLETLGDERGSVAVLNLQAILANRRSDYVLSVRLSQKSLQRARNRLGPDVVANLTNNLGLDLVYLGDYAAGLVMLQESLALWRQEGSPPEMIPVLINLGFTCSQAGMRETALAYLQEACRLAEASDDSIRQVIALANSANELGHLERFNEASDCAVRAVNKGRQLSDMRPLAHALESWAHCEVRNGEIETARGAFAEALSIYEAMDNRRGIALNYMHLAELEGASEAVRREYLTLALKAAEGAGIRPEQARALASLASLSEQSGDFRTAYGQLLAARELERAGNDEDLQRRLAAVEVQHEVDSLRRELEAERLRQTETVALLEEVRAQRELANEESRQKTAILRIAAHDLRSLTSAVLGCLELAEQGFAGGEDPKALREWVKDGREAALELLELLRRLMDLAAIERGVITLKPEPLDVFRTLEPVFPRWKRLAAAKRQLLKIRADADVWILADPDRLRQMVGNLVDNAVKYSPKGREIDVVTRKVGNLVRIAVRDRGPGMSKTDQERMFRPFQRLSAQPTGGEESTGLGLHIVRALAEKQAARLAYADRKGGGGEFYLEFSETVSSRET